jgi:hypothetical protein
MRHRQDHEQSCCERAAYLAYFAYSQTNMSHALISPDPPMRAKVFFAQQLIATENFDA